MKILTAYCLELDEVVSIDSARRYFICEEPKIDRYNFICSDENCFNDKVRISGVNYRKLATESKKFKAPHFRELDSHNEGCVWLNAHKHSTNVSHENDGGTEYENHQRTLRQKLTDLVNTFDPNPKDKTGAEGNKKQQVDDEIEGEFVDGYTGNIKNQTSVKTGEIR